MPDTLFPIIMLVIAFIFGTMAWIARNVWVDQKKTQFFALIAITSTITLMMWVFIYT